MNGPTDQTGHTHQYTKTGGNQRHHEHPAFVSQRSYRQHRNRDCQQGIGLVELVVAIIEIVVSLLVLFGAALELLPLADPIDYLCRVAPDRLIG